MQIKTTQFTPTRIAVVKSLEEAVEKYLNTAGGGQNGAAILKTVKQ